MWISHTDYFLRLLLIIYCLHKCNPYEFWSLAWSCGKSSASSFHISHIGFIAWHLYLDYLSISYLSFYSWMEPSLNWMSGTPWPSVFLQSLCHSNATAWRSKSEHSVIFAMSSGFGEQATVFHSIFFINQCNIFNLKEMQCAGKGAKGSWAPLPRGWHRVLCSFAYSGKAVRESTNSKNVCSEPCEHLLYDTLYAGFFIPAFSPSLPHRITNGIFF